MEKKKKYIEEAFSNPFNEYREQDSDGNFIDSERDYTGNGKKDDIDNNGNPYDDEHKQDKAKIDDFLAPFFKQYEEDIAEDNLKMENDKEYKEKVEKQIKENQREEEKELELHGRGIRNVFKTALYN